MAFNGLGQSLAMCEVVEGKWDDGRQPSVGRSDAAGAIVVMATQVDVAVDGPWQDIFPGGIDGGVGRWQEFIRADRHDLFAADGKAGLVCLRRGHHLSAAHDGVDFGCWHDCTSTHSAHTRFTPMLRSPAPLKADNSWFLSRGRHAIVSSATFGWSRLNGPNISEPQARDNTPPTWGCQLELCAVICV